LKDDMRRGSNMQRPPVGAVSELLLRPLAAEAWFEMILISLSWELKAGLSSGRHWGLGCRC
jgi:hypothetical protein